MSLRGVIYVSKLSKVMVVEVKEESTLEGGLIYLVGNPRMAIP